MRKHAPYDGGAGAQAGGAHRALRATRAARGTPARRCARIGAACPGPIRSSRPVRSRVSSSVAGGTRELEGDAPGVEAVDQVLEHRDGGRVDVADRRRVDEHRPRGRAGRGHEPQRLVAEVGGIGEEELVREPEQDEARDRLVLGVAVDAAEQEVLVRARLAGRAAEHGDPGPVGAPDQRQERGDDGDHDPRQDAEERNGGEPDDRELRVALVDLPQPAEAAPRRRARSRRR